MKFVVRTAKGQTRTIVPRVLAFVLLIGLVQAITFGSAHSHLNLSTALDAGRTATASGQIEQADPRPAHYRTDRQECLICLFHQQLFNSLVHTPFFVAEANVAASGAKTNDLLSYSNAFTSTPLAGLSGRAPPRL